MTKTAKKPYYHQDRVSWEITTSKCDSIQRPTPQKGPFGIAATPKKRAIWLAFEEKLRNEKRIDNLR